MASFFFFFFLQMELIVWKYIACPDFMRRYINSKITNVNDEDIAEKD